MRRVPRVLYGNGLVLEMFPERRSRSLSGFSRLPTDPRATSNRLDLPTDPRATSNTPTDPRATSNTLPTDPRATSNSRLSRPLREARDCLSRAGSVLTPAVVTCNAQVTAQVTAPVGIERQTQRHPIQSTLQPPQLWQPERLSIFRPRDSRRRIRSLLNRTRSRKRKLWERTFCCLASKTQTSPPGPSERGYLLQAGLGGKTLSFIESSDAEELHQDLLEAFPKLCTAGGYELLRTDDRNSRTLSVIPPPPTVAYLKNVTGQAKIYIRPLQKNLDTTPLQDEDTVSFKQSFLTDLEC